MWISSCLIFNTTVTEQRPASLLFGTLVPFCDPDRARDNTPHLGFDARNMIYTTPEATLLLYQHLPISLQPQEIMLHQGALKPACPIPLSL